MERISQEVVAPRNFNPAYVGSGSKPVSHEVSKCFPVCPPKPDSPNEFSDAADRDRATTPRSPQNGATRRRAFDLVPRKKFPNGRNHGRRTPPCRPRRDSSRADFCYLPRSPNNMPVRIVDNVLARSATWLARPKGFEPPTPRFVVRCSARLQDHFFVRLRPT